MRSGPLPRAAEPARGALQKLEEMVLALMLGAMIVLAALQIVLRSLLGTGIAWADPLLRVLVLWVGLLGAVAASREGRHISVDVLSRILPRRARAGVGCATSLFSAALAGIIAYHGVRFVASEFRFESVAFSGTPAWALESVIPFAFSAIALRYLRLAAGDLRVFFRGERQGDAGTAEGGAR